MLEVIESHESGDVLSVQFRDRVFGCYCVSGPVHRSATIDELTIGLSLITSGGRTPAKNVTGVWEGLLWSQDAQAECFGDISAGDLAVVRVDSFGDELQIVGYAVSQKKWPKSLAVGRHLVTTRTGDRVRQVRG